MLPTNVIMVTNHQTADSQEDGTSGCGEGEENLRTSARDSGNRDGADEESSSFRPPLRHVQDSYYSIIDVTVTSPRSELGSVRSYKLCICTVQSFRPPLRHVQDSYYSIIDVTVASPRSELGSVRSYKLCICTVQSFRPPLRHV
ncbi:hypothetical protein J6590_051966 [Homalodisca vitripennis]|nr:hypothetical protein J6590_051966 [Homalodisca vitripennis]